MAHFERYDAQVVGISVDSLPSHIAFSRSLGGLESFPLLSDFHPKGEIARRYGVYDDADGIADRAIIVVDRMGMIAWIDVHDIGEQPDNTQVLEVLRVLE